MDEAMRQSTEIYRKGNFRCIYCGFDGRPFDQWMQLSIDHVRPRSEGGSDAAENKVVACGSCNTVSCRWKPAPEHHDMPVKKLEVVSVLSKNGSFSHVALS